MNTSTGAVAQTDAQETFTASPPRLNCFQHYCCKNGRLEKETFLLACFERESAKSEKIKTFYRKSAGHCFCHGDEEWRQRNKSVSFEQNNWNPRKGQNNNFSIAERLHGHVFSDFCILRSAHSQHVHVHIWASAVWAPIDGYAQLTVACVWMISWLRSLCFSSEVLLVTHVQCFSLGISTCSRWIWHSLPIWFSVQRLSDKRWRGIDLLFLLVAKANPDWTKRGRKKAQVNFLLGFSLKTKKEALPVL